MALATGDKLGPYEILSRVGAGGMGEVWKARDTRLDRIVAIKVSSAQFSERFERESRAIAALNHANICQLYDVGEAHLVMEYIDGVPLKGPLPVDQALKYAIQICDALDAAHKKGITHRDLKPANILVTKSGVKLLDFGLAKFGTGLAGKSSNEATLTMALTGTNEIVGTLYYMSPEQLQSQATGQEIDGRSDIFFFGMVLYELLTGRRAFEGTSPASVIAAIMERPAPSIADVAPAALDRVLKRCLEKDRENRWQSARDLKAELEWIGGESDRIAIAPGESSMRLARSRWVWPAVAGVFGVTTLIAAVLAYSYSARRAPVEGVVRFSFEPSFKAAGFDVAVSPDGKRIAVADADASGMPSDSALLVRSIDSLTAEKLPGTEGARRPFWSPDGRSLGFITHRDGLRRIDLGSGPTPPQTVTATASFVGGCWSPQGVIVFAPQSTGAGLSRVAASGGTPVPVTKLDSTRQEIAHRYPQFLPDGRHFLYWVWSAVEENTGEYVGSLDLSESLPGGPLVHTWREARYTDTGYLLYLDGSTLMARRFDAARLRFTGEPRAYPEQIERHWSIAGWAMFSASSSGVLAYQESAPRPRSSLVVRDRAGTPLRVMEAPTGSQIPVLDTRETRVATAGRDENAVDELWSIDLARGLPTRLNAAHGPNQTPFWSPDGQSLVFRSIRGGNFDLYIREVSGAGADELLVKSPLEKSPTSWSRDGRFLVYEEVDPYNKDSLWVVPMEGAGERKPIPFLKTRFSESGGVLSAVPDSQGRYWIAYASDETGSEEVYLRPFLPGAPGGPAGAAVRVSARGGAWPHWRNDGRELFYVEHSKMMAVDVTLGSTLGIGEPHKLFDQPPTASPARYAAFGDGRRFLFIESVGDPFASKINVVVNWASGLK